MKKYAIVEIIEESAGMGMGGCLFGAIGFLMLGFIIFGMIRIGLALDFFVFVAPFMKEAPPTFNTICITLSAWIPCILLCTFAKKLNYFFALILCFTPIFIAFRKLAGDYYTSGIFIDALICLVATIIPSVIAQWWVKEKHANDYHFYENQYHSISTNESKLYATNFEDIDKKSDYYT